MTDEMLAEIEARANAATPGPWRVRPVEHDDWGQVRAGTVGLPLTVAMARAGELLTEGELAQHREVGTDPYGHNADFIAHARSDIPVLVSEVRRLRKREPTREEMLATLGAADEAFLGGTVRRCRHCREPVFGGPTACVRCAEREEVRRLRAALDIAIDDGNLPKSVRADIDAVLRGES